MHHPIVVVLLSLNFAHQLGTGRPCEYSAGIVAAFKGCTEPKTFVEARIVNFKILNPAALKENLTQNHPGRYRGNKNQRKNH